MDSQFQAYWADWTKSRVPPSPHAPGQLVTAEADPLAVGLRVDEALAGCPGWPVALYQVEVLAEHVLDESHRKPPALRGDKRLLVSGFRVVRQVPLEEAFGPHAPTITALLEELRHYPWLAPPAIPDEARVADLVNAHYDALARYGPVQRKSPAYVRRWQEALNIYQRITLEETIVHRAARMCVIEALKDPRTETPFARLGMRLAPYHVAYQPAWEAAWCQVAMLRSEHERLRMQRLHQEFTMAFEHSDDSPWTTAQRLDGHRDWDCNSPQGVHLRHIHEMFASPEEGDLASSWLDASNFAHNALFEASCTTRHLVGSDERPDPSRPLLELFRLGLWPIGEYHDSFVIFSPERAASTMDTAAPAAEEDPPSAGTEPAPERPAPGRRAS